MPITILYYKVSPESISSSQQSAQIADWIEELPIIKQKQVKKLRQKNDQLLSLAGLQLLKIAMSEYPDTLFSLAQLQFPKHGKPFFKGNIDFNISHSGDIVCCVLSDTAKVGIDIELQRKVNSATMNKFITESNCYAKEINVNDQQQHFFNLWTKNEAIIKAANLGSIYNMKDIKHEENGGHYQNCFWSTFPLEIISVEDNKEYTCHIACSQHIAPEKIKAKQIYNL